MLLSKENSTRKIVKQFKYYMYSIAAVSYMSVFYSGDLLYLTTLFYL